ncbi:MAG: twin-arginine translocase subunit TatC, partial [Muribaculaceae bacterium]|nr:twin-arginine translocase subunit TatC [Muribaculaceae bacterium]
KFMSLLFVMGLTFEIPLLTWALGRAGLMTRSFFTRYRRHAIVLLVVAAAVITPTSDPFTLAAVFIPLYLLWELSARLLPAK